MDNVTMAILVTGISGMLILISIAINFRFVHRHLSLIHHKIHTLMGVTDDIKALVAEQGPLLDEVANDLQFVVDKLNGTSDETELNAIKADLQNKVDKLKAIAAVFTVPPVEEPPVEGEEQA